MSGEDHSFSGLCTAVPLGSLACVPPPPPPPPPVAACAGEVQGDACSYGDPASPTTGTCDPVGERAVLVCLSVTVPPPPRIAACGGKMAGDACTLTDDGRTLDGTCKALSSGTLACALPPALRRRPLWTPARPTLLATPAPSPGRTMRR